MPAHKPAVLLLLCAGCAAGSPRTLTIVEGHLEPRHFRFVTVVEQRGTEPGGWRAACLHVPIREDFGDAFICRMGVEMPIMTVQDGLFSLPLAQRIAADCANLAAQLSLAEMAPGTPLGLACEKFRSAYGMTLDRAVEGSRVMTMCHQRTTPVRVGR